MTPANDLVTREYNRHKAEVLRTVASKLSAAGVPGAEPDLEASYNEAWHALYLALAEGEEIENRVGFLVTVTHRRALNEVRAMKFTRRTDIESLDTIGEEFDIDARLDAEIQIRHIREGFRSKLSARELEAATLCHLYGYTRPEAAEAMGVRPKRMEKIMDRASGRISAVVETVRSGEHCAELGSTIRAFSLGLLEPEGEKYKIASDHLDHCRACRREVWTDRGLAAIGPPLPVAFGLLAGGAGVGGGVAGAVALGTGKSGAPAGKLTSTGRTGMVAGAAGAVVAVVAVALAFALGVIGDSSEGENGESATSSLASAGSDAAAGGEDGSAETAAAAARRKARTAALRRAARRAHARAKARQKRKAANEARAVAAAAEAAAAEAAAATDSVPEPVYAPPVDPVPVDPAPVRPEPAKPEPERPVPPGKPADTKPITDAGEEFGLR